MRQEIAAAVVFLKRIMKKNRNLTDEQLDSFCTKLSSMLIARFKNHWYKDHPAKGQAYRCICINEAEPVDPVLERAAKETGLMYHDLRLPMEMTLWVDPLEVTCRFGEFRGSICTVASFKDGEGDSKTRNNLLYIDEALQKHQERRTADLVKFQQFVSNRSNSTDSPTSPWKSCRQEKKNHHHVPVRTGQVELSHSKPKFNPYVPQFVPPGDKFHWVRGTDAVKA